MSSDISYTKYSSDLNLGVTLKTSNIMHQSIPAAPSTPPPIPGLTPGH